MIWILGGTSEARQLSNRIADLDNFIITLATDSGPEFLDTENYRVGRLSYDDMNKFVKDNNIDLIIDLTHPFAKVVSDNGREIGKENNIKYIRYSRPKIKDKEGIILNSYEQAYKFVNENKGNMFFTTGSNNIDSFEKAKNGNRHIYRVLPALESIKKCVENNINIKDIIAVVGPFSLESNRIMFEEYKADYVIMKDSGKAGGTDNKILACKELGITPVIISREDEDGISDLDTLEQIIRDNY